MQADFNNIPPADPAAEMAALGSLILCGEDRVAFAKIRRRLWAEAFFTADHMEIFRVVAGMFDSQKPIDAVTLLGELRNRGTLDEVGGAERIGAILSGVPGYSAGEHYASIVVRCAKRRRAYQIANQLAGRMLEGMRDADESEIIQAAIEKLWKVAVAGRDLKIWKLADAIDRFIESRKTGRPIAVDTGIQRLDSEFRGIVTSGGYTLVAARPSIGKSTFIRDLLRRRAADGIPCGLVAVEENEDKIAGNILSAESNVENARVAYAYDSWSSWESEEINLAVTRIQDYPFHATDAALNLSDVLAAVEMLATQHGCKMIAVDHIHLISSPHSENRTQQINEISGALKQLFKRTGVCGIVAAQLSRPPTKGTMPPPPTLTDLRDSGSLEEHADAVLMLHREDYYRRGDGDYVPNGECQILIRKNRNGCVGEVTLKADLVHQRFEEEEVPSFD